jgi:hypothetical protein
MEESIEDQELRAKLIADINQSLDTISKNLEELQELVYEIHTGAGQHNAGWPFLVCVGYYSSSTIVTSSAGSS